MTKPGQVAPVIAFLLLTACGSQVGSGSPIGSGIATPFPSASESHADSTATPEAIHSPSARALGALAPDDLAEVVTNDLVVRSLPEISDRSVIDPITLDSGKLLFVLGGPVAADGYQWYHVQPFMEADSLPTGWPPAGWVAAASQQGDPWIAARGISCPNPDNVETAVLAELHPLEALACFGDRTMRVRARSMICPGIVPDEPPDPNYTIAPSWLGLGQGCALHTADGRTVYGAAAPFFAPGVLDDVPAGWTWLSGQFDHPAASSCVLHQQRGDPNMPAAPNLQDVQVVLLCRSHLAVELTVAAAAPPD